MYKNRDFICQTDMNEFQGLIYGCHKRKVFRKKNMETIFYVEIIENVSCDQVQLTVRQSECDNLIWKPQQLAISCLPDGYDSFRSSPLFHNLSVRHFHIRRLINRQNLGDENANKKKSNILKLYKIYQTTNYSLNIKHTRIN